MDFEPFEPFREFEPFSPFEPKDVSFKDAILLPPPPGVCQECAVEHEPEAPHNQQSLFYQYKFFQEIGRWPTWSDAMAHCDEPTRARWTEELKRLGAWLEGGTS